MELNRDGSYPGLNRFVDICHSQQYEEDLDVLIGVSGLKGAGKSTFSIQVTKRYVERFIKPTFTGADLKRYTAYTIDDVFEKLDVLPDYSPLDADEAVNFAMGEEWMRRNRKSLKKIFAKVRTKHHIFFFNIPDIWWLDKKYRENMMSFWIHIVKKGYAILSLPNVAPGIEDRWYRKWLQDAFNKRIINYFTPLDEQMKLLQKYPCLFDKFSIPILDKPLYEEHLKLREEKMLEQEKDEEDHMKKLVAYLCWKWISNNNGGEMSPEQFVNTVLWNRWSNKPQISNQTMREWIKDAENLIQFNSSVWKR
jgi:hypothetical protein